jgi:hypothetical protein
MAKLKSASSLHEGLKALSDDEAKALIKAHGTLSEAYEKSAGIQLAELQPFVHEPTTNIGGDEWNRTLAIKLDKEYADAKPQLEKIVNDAVKREATTELAPPEEAEDLGSQYGPPPLPPSGVFSPDTFKVDPLNATAGADYQKTQALGRYLFAERAQQLMQQRDVREAAFFGEKPQPIVRQDIVDTDNKMWEAWKDSSSSPEAMAMQLAAADELGGRFRDQFGHDMHKQERGKLTEVANNKFGDIGGYNGLKAMMRAKWETSQYLLDKAGINNVTVYRGLFHSALDYSQRQVGRIMENSPSMGRYDFIGSGEAHAPPQGGFPDLASAQEARQQRLDDMVFVYQRDHPDVPRVDPEELHTKAVQVKVRGTDISYGSGLEQLPSLEIKRNGLQSTSMNDQVANAWDGDHRIVLRIEAPRSAVLSLPAYGVNMMSEREVVMAGTAWSKWDVWHKMAPRHEDLPL